MFSRARFHAPSRAFPQSCRNLFRNPPAALLQLKIPTQRIPTPFSSSRPLTSFQPLQQREQLRRVRHVRWDPREIEKAEPLISGETSRFAFHWSFWIIVLAGGGGTVFYFSHIEEVPLSNRRRFNYKSQASIEANSRREYQLILNQYRNHIVPEWDPRSRMVNRIVKRLIHAGDLDNMEWEVHVIESPETNAFVLPCGKIFVFTGMFNITKNEDGLASVLGHEMAHNIARHHAENESRLIFLEPIRIIGLMLDGAGYTGGFGARLATLFFDFGIMRPGSREQESEADFIGLMLMAKACYDPREAPLVWQRMEERTKGQNPPQWMSTHPSNVNRMIMTEKLLPQAQALREENADCAATISYAKEFQKTILGGDIGNPVLGHVNKGNDPWEVMFRKR